MEHINNYDILLVFADGLEMGITKERYELTQQLYDTGIYKRGSLDRLADVEFENEIESELNRQRCISTIQKAWKDIQKNAE